MNKKKLKTALIVLIILISLILCVNVIVNAVYALTSTEVSYTKPGETTISVKEALDELYIKVPTHKIGDEVTLKGTSEKFYVLGWDNKSDTVDLIAKYNLNQAGTAQQDAAFQTTACVFSSTNYWSSSFASSPFNLNDVIGFSSTDALGKAKSYGRSLGAVSSRLLSYEEANALKTKADSNPNSKIATMLWGKENTGGFLWYWLASASDAGNVGRLRNEVSYDGYFTSGSFGVRPVITVLKSKIT